MKVCINCNSNKSYDDFNKSNNVDGLSNTCKSCKKEYDKIYRENNKDKLKSYYRNYSKQPEIFNKKKEYKKIYDDNRKPIKNAFRNNRKKIDPLFKLKEKIRTVIYCTLKTKGFKKKSKSQEILGCTNEEFKFYIESKFECWMNWNNHGLYNGDLNFGWDLDHIIPIDSAITESEILKLNHYSNFQPLCSYTNRYLKKNKWEK